MVLSEAQIPWFVGDNSELTKKPISSFSKTEGKDVAGLTKLLKISTSGTWSMRWVVWPKSGGRGVDYSFMFQPVKPLGNGRTLQIHFGTFCGNTKSTCHPFYRVRSG